MSTPSQKTKHAAMITNALVRLSSARREKLSKEDFDVYVDGLLPFGGTLAAQVCENLALEAPGEFEPRFPPLYVIRERCQRVVERERERTARLPAAKLDTLYPKLSPEEHRELMRKFIRPKVMR